MFTEAEKRFMINLIRHRTDVAMNHIKKMDTLKARDDADDNDIEWADNMIADDLAAIQRNNEIIRKLETL